MRKTLLIPLIISMIFITGCFNYSSGDRAGVITKLSYKGIFWKSQEGQLNLGGITTDSDGNVVSNVFYFSFDNQNKHNADYKKIKELIETCIDTGKRCKLHYEQELIIAPWRAGTDYIITKVEALE